MILEPACDQRLWNSAAAAWAEHVRSGSDDRWDAHAAALTGLLPPPSGLTLDVGCGEGRFARELRALGYDVVGFDASPALIREAQASDPEGAYAVAEIRSLPLADDAAALVTCVNVLQHVGDLDAALGELARVLVPGGVLLAAVVHPVAEAGAYDGELDALVVRDYFAQSVRRLPLGEAEVVHYHRTIETYLAALGAAGFAVDELREVQGRSSAVPLYLDVRLRLCS